MSKINDGGPAFPVAWGPESAPDLGMSLRDWFAGTANIDDIEFPTVDMAAQFCGRPVPDKDDFVGLLELSAATQAKLRYMAADAMLRARDEALKEVGS